MSHETQLPPLEFDAPNDDFDALFLSTYDGLTRSLGQRSGIVSSQVRRYRRHSCGHIRDGGAYRVESEEEHGDEVEAEFESGAHDSKITVRLVNGSPSAIVRERDDGAHDSDNSGHGSDREDDHGGGSGRG